MSIYAISVKLNSGGSFYRTQNGAWAMIGNVATFDSAEAAEEERQVIMEETKGKWSDRLRESVSVVRFT